MGLKRTAIEVTQNSNSAYREQCRNKRTCRRQFVKIRSRNFNLENEDRTRRPVEFDEHLLVCIT